VAFAGALAVAFSVRLDVAFAFAGTLVPAAGTLVPAAGVVFLVEGRRGGVSAVGLAAVARSLVMTRTAPGLAGRDRRRRERERRFVRLRRRRGCRGRGRGRVADRVGVLDVSTP
jgi:hypothetical protein